MVELGVVDLSGSLDPEEERRRWAAEQAVKVVCAYVSKEGSVGLATMDYALDKIADALDGYAKDGSVNRGV